MTLTHREADAPSGVQVQHVGEVEPALVVGQLGQITQACTAAGVRQSMGRTGSALDNAVAESFNSTLEFEVLAGTHFTTRQQVRRAVAGFIDDYNQTRRHSRCGGISPVAYELAAAHAHRQREHQQAAA